jgi:hypothetical protein
MKTDNTHSHKRKSGVPALAGTMPKVCVKCKLWFAARPRYRVCDSCQPGHIKAKAPDQPKLPTIAPTHTMTQECELVRSSRRSRGGQNTLGASTGRNLAYDAAQTDKLTGLSFGCSRPREQQADHLPSARRHPYAGSRPAESGWCNVACNCKCHVDAYSAAITKRNVALGLQDPRDLARYVS